MDEAFKRGTLALAVGVEAAATLVITLAAVEAFARTMFLFFVRAAGREGPKERVRLRLDRWLAVGLEFLVAADILKTAVAPTWDEIGQVAAIIALRTLLNYFLQHDIDRAAKEALIEPEGAPS